jgi:hypothetical protein
MNRTYMAATPKKFKEKNNDINNAEVIPTFQT